MNSKKTEESIMDAAIKLASARFLNSEGEKIIKEARDINLEENISDEEMVEFEKLCKKEFAKQEWKKRCISMSKVAVAVAVIAVISISGISQVQIRKNRGVTTGELGTTQNNIENHDNRIKYTPKYIPDGFVKEIRNNGKNYVKIYYIKDTEHNILFSYEKKEKGKTSKLGNIENYEEISINGIKAKVASKADKNMVKVLWEKDNHIFYIRAQGVDENEVIKIAENVN